MNMQILKLPQVKAKTGLSRGAIYGLLRRHDFPEPVKLSTKAVGWLEHEIDGWIEERAGRRKQRE